MKVLAIIVVLFSSTLVQAQATPQESKEAKAKKPILNVKLSTLKPTFCMGEEIVWRYELTNLTKQTIKFYEPYLYNNTEFHPYEDEDQKANDEREFFIEHFWPRVDPKYDKRIVLEPNVAHIETVTFSSRSEIVAKAGKYIYRVWVQGTESNEVVFEVYDCGQNKESEK